MPTKIISDKTIEVSLKFYESARSELIQRIILRDGALLFYIGVIGAYFSFVLDKAALEVVSENVDAGKFEIASLLMVPLPIICLTFTLVILQHHVIIGKIGEYLQKDLHFDQFCEYGVHQWDASPTFKDVAKIAFKMRLFAQSLSGLSR